MSETVDTNVLVYASNRSAPEQPRAVALLDHLAAGPGLVIILWPTILAYLRLVTHPAIFDRPLEPATATGNIDRLLARPNVRAVGEGTSFWDAYRTVSAPIAPRGNLVPDTHLAALMIEQGVSTIWSRDRDFRKFDGIDARDPYEDRYRDGFAGSTR